MYAIYLLGLPAFQHATMESHNWLGTKLDNEHTSSNLLQVIPIEVSVLLAISTYVHV